MTRASTVSSRPDWALPPGVSRSMWDYAAADRLAAEEDTYFAEHPLFALDRQLLAKHVPDPAEGDVAIDLGCGTGRAVIELARRGYRGIAVDLSAAMLAVVGRKATEASLPIVTVRANLVELDGIADRSVTVATCLFSTLGMIRGRTERRRTLSHVRRMLVPSGRLIVHVHNQWHYLRLPGGVRDLTRQAWSSLRPAGTTFGDRYATYRGIPQVYIHSFTPREIRTDLAAAGLRVTTWLPLHPDCDGMLTGWRRHDPTAAVGFWIVAAPT